MEDKEIHIEWKGKHAELCVECNNCTILCLVGGREMCFCDEMIQERDVDSCPKFKKI